MAYEVNTSFSRFPKFKTLSVVSECPGNARSMFSFRTGRAQRLESKDSKPYLLRLQLLDHSPPRGLLLRVVLSLEIRFPLRLSRCLYLRSSASLHVPRPLFRIRRYSAPPCIISMV